MTLFIILVKIEKWYFKADINHCNKKKTVVFFFIVTVSVPQMANAMSIQIVKTALYPSKKEDKDQESLQSSTTPDPGYQ